MIQLTLDLIGRALGRQKSPVTRTGPKTAPPEKAATEQRFVWKHGITVQIVVRPRARRYLLRLESDGSARLVIPRRGSRKQALLFLERSEMWLVARHAQWRTRSNQRRDWTDGVPILFRGEETVLRIEVSGEKSGKGAMIRFADQVVRVVHEMSDYRKPVQAHLRALAERELPPRTRKLAQVHGITIRGVTVRGQKTRWGSCSSRGTISLNWRLIQAPPPVVDYLIIHELMHRREMNHSARYWKLVAQACPDYRSAEAWLKKTRLESLE